MNEQIILVNENDNQIGTGEKLAVHQKGLLHRAFSIYIFNSDGKLLLQQRADDKYHSGGLWTNTCCGHPRPGETNADAAHRRLKEEFGFDCEFNEISPFRYKTPLNHGLTENEYLHVFIGASNIIPKPDPEEIKNHKWMSLDDIKTDINNHPENYTVWFKLIMQDNKKLQELNAAN